MQGRQSFSCARALPSMCTGILVYHGSISKALHFATALQLNIRAFTQCLWFCKDNVQQIWQSAQADTTSRAHAVRMREGASTLLRRAHQDAGQGKAGALMSIVQGPDLHNAHKRMTLHCRQDYSQTQTGCLALSCV